MQDRAVNFNELFLQLNEIGFKFTGFRTTKPRTIGAVTSEILLYAFTLGGILLLAYLIIGGFKLMTAGGDPKKMQEGQHIITNAFIGFVIIFVSFWLVQLMGKLFALQPIINIF